MTNRHEDPHVQGDPPVAADAGMMDDRRELALIAVERTRMPMVVTDPQKPDAPIVLANQAFLDLTGYTAEEVLGRNCRFLQGPDTCAADVEKIRQGLAAGGDVDVELLNYRKDGSTFINQLAISPVIGKDGTLLYYFGSQKDVTERRRAEVLEESERRLLMEVDHRTMNALAVVQSIVRLSRGDTLQSYATAIQGRIDALARAHRILASRGWSGAQLGDLIACQLTTRMSADRIDVEGPDLLLGPDLAQPVALVLHELLENALMHGALAEPEGTLKIVWQGEDDRATIRWREVSAKSVSAPSKTGFGLGTVQGVIGRQLGGTVSLDWTEQGLAADLSFGTQGRKIDSA
jgi:PAS domain S-box-containing protein